MSPSARDHYPPPTAKPCSDCPWRRVGHRRGWLGPYTADEWAEIAHGESAVACHQTIKVTVPGEDGDPVGDWDHPAMRQCRGMAIFRANVGKDPRHPEIESGPQDPAVFETNQEFIAFHEPGRTFNCGGCRGRVLYVPASNGRPAYWRHLKNPDGCKALGRAGRAFVLDPDDWRLQI